MIVLWVGLSLMVWGFLGLAVVTSHDRHKVKRHQINAAKTKETFGPAAIPHFTEAQADDLIMRSVYDDVKHGEEKAEKEWEAAHKPPGEVTQSVENVGGLFQWVTKDQRPEWFR